MIRSTSDASVAGATPDNLSMTDRGLPKIEAIPALQLTLPKRTRAAGPGWMTRTESDGVLATRAASRPINARLQTDTSRNRSNWNGRGTGQCVKWARRDVPGLLIAAALLGASGARPADSRPWAR
jgi:hypothetical protein